MSSERFEAMKKARVDFLYKRVEQLQEFLEGSEPILLMSVDGVQTQFDRNGARKELNDCYAELTKIEGKRPPMLDIFFG